MFIVKSDFENMLKNAKRRPLTQEEKEARAKKRLEKQEQHKKSPSGRADAAGFSIKHEKN